MKKISTIKDLRPDDKNANKGNARGREMIRESLQKYGAGRSILVDKDGRVIAGNKTLENAEAAGIDNCVVVRTDGKQLVVVQRTDLSLDDTRARALALADNRTNEVDLTWDVDVVRELEELLSEDEFEIFDMDSVLENLELEVQVEQKKKAASDYLLANESEDEEDEEDGQGANVAQEKYPVAVVLTRQQKTEWDELKAEKNLYSDSQLAVYLMRFYAENNS